MTHKDTWIHCWKRLLIQIYENCSVEHAALKSYFRIWNDPDPLAIFCIHGPTEQVHSGISSNLATYPSQCKGSFPDSQTSLSQCKSNGNCVIGLNGLDNSICLKALCSSWRLDVVEYPPMSRKSSVMKEIGHATKGRWECCLASPEDAFILKRCYACEQRKRFPNLCKNWCETG